MILRGQQGKKDWRKGKGIMEGKRLKTTQRRKKVKNHATQEKEVGAKDLI